MLRRLFGNMIINRSIRMIPKRGIEEFFPLNNEDGKKKITTSGGDWKAWMLRNKSTDDLHKLWFVLLKERNALNTEAAKAKMMNVPFEDPLRKRKVRKSMARIKLILHERSLIFKANKQKLKDQDIQKK